MVAGEWIPIVWAFATVGIVAVVMYYKTERVKAEAVGGGDYHKLAEEAVRSQKMVFEEVQRMNATLKEIERLLREV